MTSRQGLSIVELILTAAIISILSGIAIINGSKTLQRQQQAGAVAALQQSVWQGATSAAARGVVTELVRSGDTLTVRRSDTLAKIRSFDLHAASTTLPEGVVLTFTPPGKIDPASLDALPDELTITVNGTRYDLTFSLIGEVRLTKAGS